MLLALRVVTSIATVGEQLGRDDSDLIERLGRSDAVNEHLLRRSEDDLLRALRTELEVNVDAVEKRKIVDVRTLESEEVPINHLLIRIEEVTAKTGELVLNKALDTSILNDIQVIHGDLDIALAADVECGRDTFRSFVAFSPRSVESVTDLMPDEHIVETVAHVVPSGKSENAIPRIEHRSTRLRIVLDREVFASEKTSEKVLGSGGNGSSGLCHSGYIVPNMRQARKN